MEEEGWLAPADRAAMTFPPTVEYKRLDSMGGPVGYLLEMVRDELNRPPLELTDDEIYRKGLSVVTTIQQPLQVAAETQVAAFRAGTLPEQDGAMPNELTRVSLSSIDPKDGAIVALYGAPTSWRTRRTRRRTSPSRPGRRSSRSRSSQRSSRACP